ncbi:MAG: LPS export ABC transporter ATP-binding protein [Elusimicrobiota bacterium]|nr:LPS export ABC transporter ATP-binding protein [Endomicrobiia bacterium]MDW8164987.1 LPS export ABC transporter ATP-binding protein [Elusimicrobiota bacterium]
MGIVAENIKKIYSDLCVLNGITIHINPQEIVGLLGPNGAGKTTMFYSILGIINIDCGKIYIDGRDVSKLPVHKRVRYGIGYLSQEPSVFKKLTVEDNIRIALDIYYRDKKEKEQKLEEILNELHLSHLRKQKAYTLSGGEKRRCEIARVIVSRPKYLLLDEPFVGIDPKTIEELQNLILKLKQRGIGILLTDHNVRDTLQIVDRAYIIYKGEILIHGNATTLINDEEARRVYLGERFKM